MKYQIEVYKGQAIEYDDDYDKFICEISIEDKYKTTKRISLKDVRKEIDQFIKVNADFKPFRVLYVDMYDTDGFQVKNIIGIRTDGKFIVDVGTYKSYFGKKEMGRCKEYDPDIVEKAEALNQERQRAIKNYTTAIKQLREKLIPVDLSKYEHIINQD